MGFYPVGTAHRLAHRLSADGGESMCRNIRRLYNFEPPTADNEIRLAALQFVRKITGFTNPSLANQEAFNRAVDEIATASSKLLGSLVTAAPPRNRGREAAKAHAGATRRFDST